MTIVSLAPRWAASGSRWACLAVPSPQFLGIINCSRKLHTRPSHSFSPAYTRPSAIQQRLQAPRLPSAGPITRSPAVLSRWNSSKSSPVPSSSPKISTPWSSTPKSAPTSTSPSAQPSDSSSSAVQRMISRARDVFLRSLAKAASRSGTGMGGTDSTVSAPTYPDFRRLFSLASPEKKTLLLALSLLLVSSAVSLAVPFTIGKVIDFFTTPEPATTETTDGSADSTKKKEKTIFGMGFKSVVLVLVFVFATGAAAKAGSNIMLNLAGVRIVRMIREKCFGNAMRQEVEWADKSHGDIISRLSVDTSIVGDAVTYELGDGLRSLLTVIFSGTTMFLISPSLTLLMMGVVPPAAIGAVFYGRYLRDLTNKTQEAVGQMTRMAEERLNPQAFRTVTAFNAQAIEERRFAVKAKDIADIETKETFASGFFYAGTGFVGNCSILVLLTYGGTLVSRGVITVGNLTSLLMYTAYLGGGLASLTSFFASIMKGVGAGARVFQLIDRESEIKLAQGRSLTEAEKKKARIEFKDVHFAYPSRPGVKVLDGVNLAIERGESVALVGGSGVGKSSVHALLMRYYDPDSGTITYADTPIRELSPSSLRDQLAVVTQEPILFSGTLFENISYGCDPLPSREQVIEAAKMANCWEFVEQLPGGLDEELGSRQLSGGQRQRVAIARALCRKPKILLLDEATSALDSASEYLVNKSISDIIQQGDITVWIVAHRLSTIKSANRILVLQGGKIVENGSFEELDQPGSTFRKLVGSQIERDDEGEGDATSQEDEHWKGQEQGQTLSTPNAQQSRRYSTHSPTNRCLLHPSCTSHTEPGKGDPRLKYASSSASTVSQPLHPAIPPSPTWSIDTLLDEQPASSPFTSEELLKLHKLAALRCPETEDEMERLKQDLAGSKRLIDAVRGKAGDGVREGEKVEAIDGRVAPAVSGTTIVDLESANQGGGEEILPKRRWDGTGVLDREELLSKAARTQGGYFVVERHRQK